MHREELRVQLYMQERHTGLEGVQISAPPPMAKMKVPACTTPESTRDDASSVAWVLGLFGLGPKTKARRNRQDTQRTETHGESA